jgi:DNA (cytosine-5)-methyltransferase 1
MNELALFAGAGGGILGGKLLGWRTVCAVELSLLRPTTHAATK